MGIYLVSSNVAQSGKTTLATHITQALSVQHKTILLDIDEKKSAYTWAVQHNRHFDYEHLIYNASETEFLKNRIGQLKQKYTHIVIDADGQDTPALRSILMQTDKLIIPVKDLRQDLIQMNELISVAIAVKQLNTELKIYVVLNNQLKDILLDELTSQKRLLQDFPIYFLNACIYEEPDYVRALDEGQHIWQLNQDAAEIFDQFMQELEA